MTNTDLLDLLKELSSSPVVSEWIEFKDDTGNAK
jgi:hypothetical protein